MIEGVVDSDFQWIAGVTALGKWFNDHGFLWTITISDVICALGIVVACRRLRQIFEEMRKQRGLGF
jgi:hypothetical protein